MSTNKTAVDTFAMDIEEGLRSSPKFLSSKYFYNAEGDRLFQEIMSMPEYYLTNAEAEILDKQSDAIRTSFGNQPVDIIELGAGDGSKTKFLLKNMVDNKMDVRYIPSDISPNILAELKSNFATEIPNLEVITLAGDYFTSLVDLPDSTGRKRILLYLGANIGNLEKSHAAEFIGQLKQFLNLGDSIMIGFDLKKDPQTILDAYNDPAGITAAFNINLLNRINIELDADFNVEQFSHWERYNPETGAARSYLVSRKKQKVNIGALEQSFEFEAWETIRMELSQKYGMNDIAELAKNSGYKFAERFVDSRGYFVDAVFEM